jgi:hypothetical protein
MTANSRENGDDRRLRAWRRWHYARLAEALAGPHGNKVHELLGFLGGMTVRSMPELLNLIRTQNWQTIDAETRLTVLHEVNEAITRVREEHGAAPFNDALPGQPDTGFLIVKQLLR